MERRSIVFTPNTITYAVPVASTSSVRLCIIELKQQR